MDFGKVANPSRIDFSLPTDDLSNFEFLASKAEGEYTPVVRIGCPVWSRKEWLGKVYPKGTPARDYLKFYSQSFDSIELNSTHYHLPSRETVQRWKDDVGENFRFVAKIPQQMSHRQELLAIESGLEEFLITLKPLGYLWPMSFLQLGPTFDIDKWDRLQKFIRLWPLDLGLSVELRHPSWFENFQLKKTATEFFRKNNVGTVITDTPGRRDVLHTTITATKVMVRFAGNNLHETDFDRLTEWAFRIKEWLEAGVQEVYFFVHEPDDAFAIEIGRYIIEQLNEICDLDLEVPNFASEQSQMSLLE